MNGLGRVRICGTLPHVSSFLECLSEMRGLSVQHIPSSVLAHEEQLVTQLSSAGTRHADDSDSSVQLMHVP